MNNFNFYSPTKLFFGKESEKEIGKIIKSYNFNNVAFVYGKSSIKVNGLYDIVIDSLKNEGINYIELSGVEANPKLSLVKKFKEQLIGKQIDLILAVGGGSVIDTAKSLAHAINYDGNPFDFNIFSISLILICLILFHLCFNHFFKRIFINMKLCKY